MASALDESIFWFCFQTAEAPDYLIAKRTCTHFPIGQSARKYALPSHWTEAYVFGSGIVPGLHLPFRYFVGDVRKSVYL